MLFDVPLETCVARDEKRERSVGRLVIERQYEFFERAKAAIRKEGFDQILEFQDGELDQVQFEIMFRPVPRQNHRPQKPEAMPAYPAERRAAPAPQPRVGGRETPPVAERKAPAAPAPPPAVARPAAKPAKPVPPAHTSQTPRVTPGPAVPTPQSSQNPSAVGSVATQSTGGK
jgi:hypothetical protein